MTGGSDFHGIYGSSTVTLGSCTTPDEQLDKLMGYKAKRKRAQRKAEKEALANAQKICMTADFAKAILQQCWGIFFA